MVDLDSEEWRRTRCYWTQKRRNLVHELSYIVEYCRALQSSGLPPATRILLTSDRREHDGCFRSVNTRSAQVYASRTSQVLLHYHGLEALQVWRDGEPCKAR